MYRSRVIHQFQKLEQSKIQLLEELALLNADALQFHPAKDKWNIVQIIFHLNSAESSSVRYITKKLQGGFSVPKSSLINSLRSSLLSLALRFLKWKKPAVLPDPPENSEAGEVIRSWGETRIELRQLLEQVPEEMLGRNIFRHPAAGRMNMSQALKFMQDHFNHHLRQIEERIATVKKSS